MTALGILDQSRIPKAVSAAEALQNSVDLAGLGEELGYRRYWVAKYHGMPGLACAAPEVLIGAPIAASQA